MRPIKQKRKRKKNLRGSEVKTTKRNQLRPFFSFFGWFFSAVHLPFIFCLRFFFRFFFQIEWTLLRLDKILCDVPLTPITPYGTMFFSNMEKYLSPYLQSGLFYHLRAKIKVLNSSFLFVFSLPFPLSFPLPSHLLIFWSLFFPFLSVFSFLF